MSPENVLTVRISPENSDANKSPENATDTSVQHPQRTMSQQRSQLLRSANHNERHMIFSLPGLGTVANSATKRPARPPASAACQAIFLKSL